jgi:hypothetical protein
MDQRFVGNYLNVADDKVTLFSTVFLPSCCLRMKFLQREYTFSASGIRYGLLMRTLPCVTRVLDKQQKMHNLKADSVCFIMSGIEFFPPSPF